MFSSISVITDPKREKVLLYLISTYAYTQTFSFTDGLSELINSLIKGEYYLINKIIFSIKEIKY